MISIKRSELASRVETAANLGFLCAIPAVVLTAGVAAEMPNLTTYGQFVGALLLLALAIGTYKRHRVAAVGQVIAFAFGASYMVYEDIMAVVQESSIPLVTLFAIGIGFLLVRGARATFVLHGVRRFPIPRESRYSYRPTSETVVIR